MVSKNIICVLVALYCNFNKINGQEDCVPGRLEYVGIAANATLSWKMEADEECEITEYQVDITSDREVAYHYSLAENHLDLSFMEICEFWEFRVTPFSNGTEGTSSTLPDYIPMPPDSDLTLNELEVTPLGDNVIAVEWTLRNQPQYNCTLEYRFTLIDEDFGTIQNFSLMISPLITTLASACVSYEVGMRAINRAHPIVEGPLEFELFEIPPTPQKAPVLDDLDIQATSINMTWILEGNSNRCPLNALYIDAGNNFNISIPLTNEVNPESVQVELKSLKPNTMYYMKVYVENSGGVSTATQIAIQTLELEYNRIVI